MGKNTQSHCSSLLRLIFSEVTNWTCSVGCGAVFDVITPIRMAYYYPIGVHLFWYSLPWIIILHTALLRLYDVFAIQQCSKWNFSYLAFEYLFCIIEENRLQNYTNWYLNASCYFRFWAFPLYAPTFYYNLQPFVSLPSQQLVDLHFNSCYLYLVQEKFSLSER